MDLFSEDPSRRVVQPKAPGDWDFVWHGHRGIPSRGSVKREGDEPIVVESEPAYLERGGFLAEGERDRIPDERFDPEEIDDLTLATGHFERANDDRLRADSNQKGSAA